MIRFSQMQIRQMAKQGVAKDITKYNDVQCDELVKNECYLKEVGYSYGQYGKNASLLQGGRTEKLYAITNNSTILYYFG